MNFIEPYTELSIFKTTEDMDSILKNYGLSKLKDYIKPAESFPELNMKKFEDVFPKK